MKISELTRRDIVDAIIVENVRWWGRLDEIAFLSRIYDLQSIPSTDPRFGDAARDIYQHRFNNDDWENDWVFHDDRFSLKNGDDEILLKFLCETIHPVVCPDVTEAQRLSQLYNQYLKNDGYEIVEKTRISNKPVFVGRYVGIIGTPVLATAKATLSGLDAGYVSQQITRMESAVINDPRLAIGTAKELVETCCKTILARKNVSVSASLDLPQLVKETTKALALTPDHIPDEAKAAKIIKILLSNLATVTQGIAELRNHYGTGHGQIAGNQGLSSRHAKLAVGAASTLAVFLLETYEARENPI